MFGQVVTYIDWHLFLFVLKANLMTLVSEAVTNGFILPDKFVIVCKL